jgi:lysophospholipase L1-like esterase
MSKSSRIGIPSFSELQNHPEKIIRAALKSTDASENGISFGSFQGSVGHVFSSDGVDPTQTGKPILFDIPAYDASLKVSGCLGLTLSAGMNSDDFIVGASRYLMSANQFNLEWRATERFRVVFDNGLNGYDFVVSPLGKDAGYNVVINWDLNFVDWYLDGLPFVRLVPLTPPIGSWTKFYFAGLSTVAGNYGDFLGNAVKDAFLLGENQIIADSGEKVLFLGDSITCQGGQPSQFYSPIGGLPPLWVTDNGLTTGNGFQSDGITDYGPGLHRDVGYIPQVFRELFKKGINCYDNKNYAQSGGTISAAEAQLARIPSAYIPTSVCCLLGTNNAASPGMNPTTAENDYKSLITALYNRGVNRVVIGTIPSLEASAGGSTDLSGEPYITNVNAINSIVVGLPGWAAAQGYGDFVRVANVFNALGGHSPSALDFQSTNLHPNENGSYKIGVTVGHVMTKLVTKSVALGIARSPWRSD